MKEPYLVELKNITKRFPGVVANDRVNFNVRQGEIHVLLGENGSGKSTLMSVLCGLYRPDEGEIIIRGTKMSFRSPRQAIMAGVGMVHQHFKLIDSFSVAENVILGDERIPRVLNMQQIENNLAQLSARYGLQINPSAMVWQLSVGEKQRVEIVKMLYRGTHVLILDEPTAVLTPQETGELFRNLREMADSGRGIVVITHKMHEVMAIADRVTILRRGRSVATLEKEQINRRDLAWLMVGHDVVRQIAKKTPPGNKNVLTLKNVHCLNDLGRPGLTDISFTVRSGEIFGIAGVAGNGQRELAEVIAGLRPLTRGEVFINDYNITNCSPRQAIDRGVSLVPEDRLGTGLVPNLNAVDNLILKGYRKGRLRWGPFLKRNIAKEKAEELVERFDISLSALDAPVKLLSGGNLQKLLLAREITSSPQLLIAVYPVRGLDIKATEAVHNLLLEQRSKGLAVLLISEDLEEIFKLSDRIGVLCGGHITGVMPADMTDVEEIGLLMMGIKNQGDNNI
ncbi:ABC transporter ATP-binding protein [Desulfallas thermosapovorans]|uniref:Nucleoside ABC transporter ATP-binding protein n=1 Tax=Desulfallas thermosapovorans DSM 6562 TaxID=1121431 RepID=A0A5S4ZQK4_9FIRM|nr:ABC transporter ATP-binding protein [Desulfallas thermosapovorans]TYO94977.1 nucleoside ABC transporter ATP-binding protein [Desulfallas thermosapovorans DSM 6562]